MRIHQVTYPIFMLIFIAITLDAAYAASIMPISCDGMIVSDVLGEEVCVYGTGFDPETEVDIYVVKDKDIYTPGEELQDETGSVETVRTSNKGVLAITRVWDRIKKGLYDIVVDLNRDGRFDEDEPVNVGDGPGLRSHDNAEFCFYYPDDASCIEDDGSDDEGYEEVPEFTTIGAILALGGIGYYIHRRRR